jgi:hypothetical protein
VPFTLRNLEADLDDVGSNFDGAPELEFRFATKALELEQSGLSYQRIPPGSRFPYGHTHKVQEELYVVVRGSGRMKLDDEIVFGAPNLGDDPREDVEGQRDWWAS